MFMIFQPLNLYLLSNLTAEKLEALYVSQLYDLPSFSILRQ